MIVIGGLITVLFIVIYQDFKFLEISWWTLPILAVFATINGIKQIGIEQFLLGSFINIVFIIFQIFMLTAYFSIKNKHIVNITKQYLGVGDICFFLFLAFCFEPFHFILFFTCSLLVIILFFTVLKAFHIYNKQHIPLAGALSLFYLPYVVITTLTGYNTYYINHFKFLFV